MQDGELESLVLGGHDGLLGVNIYGIKSFDLLVEAVGAPPTGPLTSIIIDLGDTELVCSCISSI